MFVLADDFPGFDPFTSFNYCLSKLLMIYKTPDFSYHVILMAHGSVPKGIQRENANGNSEIGSRSKGH